MGFDYEDTITLDNVTYWVVARGSVYADLYDDYEDGFYKCTDVEIKDVDVDYIEVQDFETEKEIKDNKIIQEMKEILTEWVKDGSIEIEYD